MSGDDKRSPLDYYDLTDEDVSRAVKAWWSTTGDMHPNYTPNAHDMAAMAYALHAAFAWRNSHLQATLAALKTDNIRMKQALEEIKSNCDPDDSEWHVPADGRRACYDIAHSALKESS